MTVAASGTPSPRSIAIDARHLRSSTGTYMNRLLAHLQEVDRENRYTVLLLNRDAHTWRPTAPNFHVEAVPYPCYSFAEQLGFKRFLDARRFDLVHFCMPQQPVLYRGLSVTTFHDLTLLKTVHSEKNQLVYRAKQAVAKVAFRLAAAKNRLLLVPSEFTKRDMQERLGTPADKMVVTYESAERQEAASEPVPVAATRFLLYVGQQSDYKNLERLAEAHQLLRRTHPDLGLVLAGKLDTAAERNRERFAERGWSGIEFPGWVSDGQLNWLYEHAEAYVFPSLMEGFGLPGLEAMLHGLPVVSSNATCLPEIYGDAAEYFDPTDAEAIATAIGEVVGSPARRAELVAAGTRRLERYDWRRMAEETHAVYLRALGLQPAPAELEAATRG
jgi:glycosyltransferase involved in cell wall biosynthesis